MGMSWPPESWSLGIAWRAFLGMIPETTGAREEISNAPNFGFSPTVNQGIATTFSNTVTGFEEGFSGLSNHIEQAGFDPQVVAERYPEDTGRMVSAYLDHPDRIDQADDPLLEAARLGGADGFRADIFGGDESQHAPEPPLPSDGILESG